MWPGGGSARGAAAIAASTALLLASLACGHKAGGRAARGVFVSASPTLATYVGVRGRLDAGRDSRFFFPELQVFDGSGRMIYSSHQAVENALVLERLPHAMRGLRPIPGAPRLSQLVEAVPAFRRHEAEIVGHHGASVLSVFLEDCQACGSQEDALDGAERRLLDRGVNLLVIRASRP